MNPPVIRVIAICLFCSKDQILVFEAFDSVKGTPFYRPLGGAVEPGETTEQALIREIREELGQEITDLKLLSVIENLFTYEGSPGHEIVFVYDGIFADPAFYDQESITVYEDNGDVLQASWKSLEFFDEFHRLVPEELVPFLAK